MHTGASDLRAAAHACTPVRALSVRGNHLEHAAAQQQSLATARA